MLPTKQTQPGAESVCLREISGRLKKLSYREMRRFALTVEGHLQNNIGDTEGIISAILKAADDMENA